MAPNILANGNNYVDELRGGFPNGQKTYTWAVGLRYVGEHKDGLSHGYSTQNSTDRTVKKKGFWVNEKLVRSTQ